MGGEAKAGGFLNLIIAHLQTMEGLPILIGKIP
jgi:hypothetical protein